MTFVWNAKNNFILLHFINLHQQQSLTLDINWLSIVNDIHLEISSTPMLLKNQYEYLLENFYSKQESISLYSTLKHNYLHSLCQKIEDNFKFTLESVYELIRHIRTQRINIDDIEKLINEWNFNYSSDEEKENKNRLFNILNRLLDYIRTLSRNSYQSIDDHLINESSINQKNINDEELVLISENDDEISITNKQNRLISIDHNRLISNINEQENSCFIRRRSQSLTLSTIVKDNQVNIGIEWFVPKLKRQQRSSSLHTRSYSPTSMNTSSSLQNQNSTSNEILMTTIDNDESSDSTSNSNQQKIETHTVISSLSCTNEKVLENEHQQIQLNFIDGQQLDPVSSSDSDSIEVQWSTSTNNKPSTSSSSHNIHQQGNNSCKRQRLS